MQFSAILEWLEKRFCMCVIINISMSSQNIIVYSEKVREFLWFQRLPCIRNLIQENHSCPSCKTTNISKLFIKNAPQNMRSNFIELLTFTLAKSSGKIGLLVNCRRSTPLTILWFYCRTLNGSRLWRYTLERQQFDDFIILWSINYSWVLVYTYQHWYF